MVAQARLEQRGVVRDPAPRRGVYGFVAYGPASRSRGASRPRLVGRATSAGAVPLERFAPPRCAPRCESFPAARFSRVAARAPDPLPRNSVSRSVANSAQTGATAITRM